MLRDRSRRRDTTAKDTVIAAWRLTTATILALILVVQRRMMDDLALSGVRS